MSERTDAVVMYALQLVPGDRFLGKGDRIWVVLSVQDDSQRVVTDLEGKPHVVTVTPPRDLKVVVLNRDERITTQQAVANLKAAGLDPQPIEDQENET